MKNTIQALSAHYKKNGSKHPLAVLTIRTGREQMYEEDGVFVWRVFERNKPSSYFALLRAIRAFKEVKNVVIAFEFASFGDTKTTALFPSVLLILRVLRKRVTLILHQVVSETKTLSGHVGWGRSSLKPRIFNLLVRTFLLSLVFLSNTVVVLEEAIRKRLVKMVGMEEKITIIPHGIEAQVKKVDKREARRKLGMQYDVFILLYFGYLTWYKGVDFLIRAFAKRKVRVHGKPARLIIAGGESTTQKHKGHYQQFVSSVFKLAKKSSDVTISGFIEEKDIPYYFAAADLVVLPYRTFMSSSGSLALACAFEKPFIMSSRLKPYFHSPDFFESLKKVGLAKQDVTFSLEGKGLLTKVASITKKNVLPKLTKLSQRLKEQRSFSHQSTKYVPLFESVSTPLLTTIPLPSGS